MAGQIEATVERINAALVRIEAVSQRAPVPTQVIDPKAHEHLREAAAEAVAALDRLIGEAR